MTYCHLQNGHLEFSFHIVHLTTGCLCSWAVPMSCYLLKCTFKICAPKYYFWGGNAKDWPLSSYFNPTEHCVITCRRWQKTLQCGVQPHTQRITLVSSQHIAAQHLLYSRSYSLQRDPSHCLLHYFDNIICQSSPTKIVKKKKKQRRNSMG